MSTDLPALELVHPGLGATLQDRGRAGWRRFGVPPGGPMDEHAAAWGNRLLDNPLDAPVLELLLQGARIRARRRVWVAITGAIAQEDFPMWQAIRLEEDDLLDFSRNLSGVWTYLAIEGGFEGRRWLSSLSGYPRAHLGNLCGTGDLLSTAEHSPFALPPSVVARWAHPSERWDYLAPPPLRVWPGPQWEQIGPGLRERFFDQNWTVAAQSDRVGYRLAGQALKSAGGQIISEPVRIGSIQVPEDGQPVVTMRDGPTVGGYPKLGMVDPRDLPWLAQCRPGQKIKFEAIDAAGS